MQSAEYQVLGSDGFQPPAQGEHGWINGEGQMILPVVLNMECTATEVEMNENVSATLKRGYESIVPYLSKELDRPVALCGSGPSLREHIEEVKKFDVFAVNSAHKFLLENGVVPKYTMIWDCDRICAQFAVPHPDTTFLIASRCHPEVFERLKGCKVVVWHACGDHNILDFMEKNGVTEPLINGGTTGITRGIYVAFAIGYREFHLFGGDSSYKDDQSHVAGSLVHEQRMRVMVNGGAKWFDSTPQWAAQIEEMKIMVPMFKQNAGTEMYAYDDGMMGYVMSIMRAYPENALANAMRMIEVQKEQKGAPAPGSPGVLPEGTIRKIHESAPHLAEGAMKTLQPLEEGRA